MPLQLELSNHGSIVILLLFEPKQDVIVIYLVCLWPVS